MSQSPQKYSKIDKCPNCLRVLCKRPTISGELMIHVKHRGFELWAKDLIINCISCNNKYQISSDEGIQQEIVLNE